MVYKLSECLIMMIIDDVQRIVKGKNNVCNHSTNSWNFAAAGFSPRWLDHPTGCGDWRLRTYLRVGNFVKNPSSPRKQGPT